MANYRAKFRGGGSTTYEVRWTDPATGKQRSASFKIEDQAKKFVLQLNAFHQNEVAATRSMVALTATGLTVTEVLRRHVAQRTGASSGTIRTYESFIRDHFESSALGVTAINTVSRNDVILFVQDLRKKGLSPKSIKNLHGFLSASFKTAILDGLMASNPCAGVQLPKVTVGGDTMRLLSHGDFQRLYDSMNPAFKPFILFLVSTGLRWGEATALTVGDLNLRSVPATVRVNKAWVRGGNSSWSVGPPKTRKSIRTVPVGAGLQAVLLPLTEERKADELLFTNSYGRRILQSSFWEGPWSTAVRKAGLGFTPRVHDLRHTAASWLIADGASLMQVQAVLGHESITTTIDRYSHLMPDDQLKTAAVADKAIGRLKL